MGKLHFYKLKPSEILSRIITMDIEARGNWITEFAIDLERCDLKTTKTDLAKQLIKEATEFRKKKSNAGKLGGLAKASTAKAKASIPLANSSSSTRPKPSFVGEIAEVITHLNKKTGKDFSVKAKGNTEYISGRLSDGYAVVDLKKVIDNQFDDWQGDIKMEKYLRPQTLFAPTKFDGYLNNGKSTPAMKPFDPNKGY